MKLNNVIIEHIRYRFKMWQWNSLLIGEEDAVCNAVAIAEWHQNLICTKIKGHIMIPPQDYVNVLKARGIDVVAESENEFSFTIENLLFVLFLSHFFCAEETLCGIGYPANRCITSTICMKPEEFADYLFEFAALIPTIKKVALEIAEEVNSETRVLYGNSVKERVIDKEKRHPVIDSWVIESNFCWGDHGERLLVGIGDEPMTICPSNNDYNE